jgi:hypothetical protein
MNSNSCSMTQMRMKLQTHLEEKIKGNIWDNEIRSRLARPLSASTFCCRGDQLRHPLSAAQFLGAATRRTEPEESNSPETSDPTSTPKFPYSVEAHAFANCIRRCRLKACFRVALKARAWLPPSLSQGRCLQVVRPSVEIEAQDESAAGGEDADSSVFYKDRRGRHS